VKKIRNKVSGYFNQQIWLASLDNEPPIKQFVFKMLRVLFALRRDIQKKQLALYATSLVYTTLLSLVPLLAVSFSILHAFGVHNQIEPLLLNLMAPLGDKATEITHSIISFVENINVGVLGAIGITVLLYTAISTISKIETAFNYIWNQPKSRPILRRVTDYLSVLVFGPVLIFSAIGLIASMSNSTLTQGLLSIEPFGSILIYIGQLTPYLLIITAFTFVYIFIPNTRVNFKAALLGAIIAGITWKLAGWLFALFVSNSTNYDAIYSSLGILLFFIIWLELSWLILLIGGQLSFYFQNPQYLRTGNKSNTLNPATQELLGLYIMDTIIEHYKTTQIPQTADEIARKLAIPTPVIAQLLNAFTDKDILVKSADTPNRYLPATDPDNISTYQIINAIRHQSTTDVATQHLDAPHVDNIQKYIEEQLQLNFSQTYTKTKADHTTQPHPQ